MIPETYTKLEGQQANTMIRLLEALEDHDDVEHVYSNFDIDEKQFGAVEPGQEVRLFSSMYNHRLYGPAAARIERLEPSGEAAAGFSNSASGDSAGAASSTSVTVKVEP